MELPNKKGKYGNINITGRPASTAYQVDPDEEYFWDNIEEGIKPLVKVFVAKNYPIMSSCEGHYYEGKHYTGIGNSQRAMVSFCFYDKVEALQIERLVKRNNERSKTKFKTESYCPDFVEKKYGRNGIQFDLICKNTPNGKNREAINKAIKELAGFMDKNLTRYFSPDKNTFFLRLNIFLKKLVNFFKLQ